MGEPDTDLVTDRLLHRLRLALLAITTTTLGGFALPLLAANPEVYRDLTRQVVAFALLTGVLLVSGWHVLRRRFPGRSRWVQVAVVFTASGLATTGIAPERLMWEAEWSYGVIGWFVLLVLVGRGAVAAVVFLGVHTVVSFGQLLLVGPADEVADLVVVTTVVLGCQLPVVAVVAALRGLTATAAAASLRAERVRTADAIAEHLHADRQARYADLAGTTVPLLTDLTTGAADLSDDGVRAAYAVAAARHRRLFAEHDDVVDPLLHELRACVDLAERQGVAVYLGTCGERPTPPLEVRRALTEPALRIMATASRARVTVLGTPTGVAVSVLADTPAGPAPAEIGTGEIGTGEVGTAEIGTAGVTVTRLVDGARVWVEATWRVGD
ncbi:hypothetical protein ABZ816_02755 [Actinosynnema sp. NPDC047251]|uniref:Putative membrane protein n=1 Tax=Saccharothrix espanaensis (strain ATCC 51144 / DSM 44229 / JCM 9112 / NBRC 15066 / NRRL 15764) TaxID=1179773 RepID=K0K3R9_SACES|nr:hypothetical protein [Saccharothrix espanaensis]CCH31173.1 putative membrane protein [Saccharothrix espanaensis DSM 44229]